VSTGHHGATPGRHHDRPARSIAGRGRKGLRLIPRSQPIPEARPQPEIAARSAEPAPRILARVRARVLPTRASPGNGHRAGSALHPLGGLSFPDRHPGYQQTTLLRPLLAPEPVRHRLKHMRDEIWCWIPVANENPYCIWLERSLAADKFEIEALIAALQEMTPFRRRAAARCRRAGCERRRACQAPLRCHDKFVRARAERDWEEGKARRNAIISLAARHAQDCVRAAKLVRAARARLKSLVSAREPD
jgi:hypothetical protein